MFRDVFLFFSTIAIANSQVTFNSWQLKNSNGSFNNIQAVVPGGIYSDLMKNKIIEDIFYGFNDINYKWVARENWTYYTNFTVDDKFFSNEYINIVFEGLDTFATIIVNDVEVGRSQNMFVRYIFDIKQVLKAGVNQIEVQFQSPVDVANDLAKQQSQTYVIPPECPPNAYNGECHVNQIRKMQASFSWDWGPSFPSVGIWKDVFVRGYDSNIIEYVVTDVTEANTDEWNVNIDVYFSNDTDYVFGTTVVELQLEDKKLSFTSMENVTKNEYGEFVRTISFLVQKYDTKLWWPNGYGSQILYNLSVQFTNENSVSKHLKRIGFRMVELVQDQIENGLSFYFKVNDVPIFMKGANEIPIDILPERGYDEKKTKKLLSTVYDSHMNMLRVWGGGVYESDYFYDTADELGIMILQDFMFSCALYPVHDAFLSNVLDEVRHQVKRLYSHPCIALFAGNNENEAAIAQNWYNTNNNKQQFVKDYVKLYIDTIETEYNRLTHNRGLFLSSSPSNGEQSKKEGYVAANPGSSLYGDVHFYNYVLDSFATTTYPIPRFASEYGYQSFPSVESMLTATSNVTDLDINSKFMDHRQHHPQGNTEIKTLIDYQLTLPNENNKNYYKAFIYYSQIIQAMSTKIETEHYRAHREGLDSAGQGNTMGALYWQLNDVWIGPTWSGIDYLGKWKMMQYYATEFFAPIIVTGSLNAERELSIYVVSDLLSLVTNATFVLDVFKWNATTLEPVFTKTQTTDLDPSTSKLLTKIVTDEYLSAIEACGDAPTAKYNCFFHIVLQKDGVNISPDNFVYPSKIKDSNIQTPKISVSSVKLIGVGKFKISLTTDKIAVFVWLEVHNIDGRFSENGFVQISNTKTIYFYSDVNVIVDELRDNLTVTNLRDEIYG